MTFTPTRVQTVVLTEDKLHRVCVRNVNLQNGKRIGTAMIDNHVKPVIESIRGHWVVDKAAEKKIKFNAAKATAWRKERGLSW